jgi:hypothetical protein
MHPAKRFYLRWTRTLHIYLSVFALVALALFAATGFMLNHPEWFWLDQTQTSKVEGDLPLALVAQPLDRLAVVERLRADFGAVGLVESFEIDEDEAKEGALRPIRIVFKSPGRTVTARIEGRTSTAEGNLPMALLAEPLDRPALVERLRADFGADGAVDAFEVDTEAQRIRIVFKSASRAVTVRIEADTGRAEAETETAHVEAETESWGVLGRLTDLHRGNRGNAGPVWSFVIDTVSGLLLFVSLTGLLLWISLKRRLVLGILALLTSTVALLALYFVFVP